MLKRMIAAALIISAAPAALAAENISVIVNGAPVEFDVPPQIIEERTMVPMRAAFEALGARVEWAEDARLIVAAYGTRIIAMEIGVKRFTVTDVVSGETTSIELDVPPQIADDRALVPIRAVSEALGKTVEWNENRVIISDK